METSYMWDLLILTVFPAAIIATVVAIMIMGFKVVFLKGETNDW